MTPPNPIIIVGGGLAGLSAAHQCYLRGSNVVLVDKQGFLSGNSGKATSGINGALTRTQTDLGIADSVQQFYDDTLRTAKDRANPDLIRVLTYNSADAVHWLQEVFGLDLSVVSRLGGHSQPRTHRGRDAKFPGMAITYALLERLEDLAAREPHRIEILKKCQVIDLLEDKHQVRGVKYKRQSDKSKHELRGPVILATGGYAADFTKNSLLRRYRPDIIDLPSTNGVHATGDGQKIVLKHHGVGIDLDKVQVHPTGLINLDDTACIRGEKSPRFLFLGAEALRGEGGIMLNRDGERFCDELGTRDYVSGEMEKQLKQGKGPIRLVLNASAEPRLDFHIKHYMSRNLMKQVSGAELAREFGPDGADKLRQTLEQYNSAAIDKSDAFGKKFFPATPFELEQSGTYYMSFVTRVLHFTMGGIKINDKTEVLYQSGEDTYAPFEGLYACGEVAGGVHGHNRLGGSSLLACVVYGRVAADCATKHVLEQMSRASRAADRLSQVSVHLGQNRITIDLGGDAQAGAQGEAASARPPASEAPSATEHPTPTPNDQFEIPAKEFTAEEVAKHNTRSDCWCIVKNVVLDLTHFLKDHPGGEDSILNFAGKDATESFDMLHEDNVIVRYAKECVLGRLKGKTPALQL
ncbi:Cytochrome b5 heme-binding domain-containing protein [[Candida] zeylanoides]